MYTARKFLVLILVILLGVGIFTADALPATAQGPVIPSNATITSATLSVYVNNVTNQTVRVHRITAPWVESGPGAVTWANFGGSYDPAVIGTFVADGLGYHAVDVTTLAQTWVNGTYPNNGVLLEQGLTAYTDMSSSEHASVTHRPMLEICFTIPGGSSTPTCVTIRRPGTVREDVFDAYIWQEEPDYNGDSDTLYTGYFIQSEKQSLLRFSFDVPTAVTLSSFSASAESENTAMFIGLGTIGALALVGSGLYLARKKLAPV